MANDILTSLLREYDQKKLQAELEAEKRKETLYSSFPRLSEIDTELHTLGIQVSKSILLHPENSSALVHNLNTKIEHLKTEKQTILVKNGYPTTYLTPTYECSICQDTGYIMDREHHTSMCSCLKQKLLDISFNKSNMYGLKKENFQNFNELRFSDEVDLSKYKLNISPRKNILNIKKRCLEFINNFDDLDSKNLLFTGATGLRKNLYVKLYCNTIIAKRKNSSLSNCTCFA